MNNDIVEIMTERLCKCEELRDFRVIRADCFTQVGYPVDKPSAVIGREEEDGLGYLLGCEDSLFGGEKLSVSVMTDEKHGGAFCEEKAKAVCRAMLDNDPDKMIVSVCVEKCMYDKTCFAYKVIMRFTLREHEMHI